MHAVELHLHRGAGIGYGAVAAVVSLFVLLGVGADLADGRFWMALVTAVVGLAVAAFLAKIAAAILVPALTADAVGVRGRVARRKVVDAAWREVTLDVDEDAAPGTIRVDVGGESLSLSGRSWLGFRDFVILVGSTPAATSRLTPAARAEVVRLLQIAGQGPGAPFPDLRER